MRHEDIALVRRLVFGEGVGIRVRLGGGGLIAGAVGAPVHNLGHLVAAPEDRKMIGCERWGPSGRATSANHTAPFSGGRGGLAYHRTSIRAEAFDLVLQTGTAARDSTVTHPPTTSG